MGQKVNPHGMRVGVIKNWDSRWFARDEVFGDTLVNDKKIRDYLKKKLMAAGVPKIEIERDNAGRVRVFIHCAKPGLIIGRGGTEIDKLRKELEEMTGKTVSVNVAEVKPVEMCAQLVAESIASQLERRIGFRRAMKLSIQRTMRMGAKGIKVAVGGRLGGAEIARTEHYHEGTIPLQTIRADIDYGFWEASTTYGKIGVKVWIYKGEILPEVNRPAGTSALDHRPPKPQIRDRRNDRRDDRRPGGGGYGSNNSSYGNRPQGQGSYGSRPQGQGSYGNRPQGQGQGYGNRPQGQGYGNRPQGQGSYGNRPQGQGFNPRPQGQGYTGGRTAPAAPKPAGNTTTDTQGGGR